jgi:hypothetical protein
MEAPVKQVLRASALVVLATVTLVGAFAVPAFAKTDKQIAKASTLTIDDISGTGWSQEPHERDADSDLPSCRPTNKAKAAARKGGANSPDFQNVDGTTVTNVVYVFPNVKKATAYLAAFKLPTALECLQQSLDENLASKPGASASVEDLDVSGGPVDDGIGFQGVIVGVDTAQAGVTDTYIQAVAFRVGRAVTGFTTTNPGTAYPDTVDLVTTQVARLKKNLK